MALEQYLGVTSLIQYYQMEVRWSIRQRLLTAFGAMCSLDKTVVAIILNSVLPMELARYINSFLFFSNILKLFLFIYIVKLNYCYLLKENFQLKHFKYIMRYSYQVHNISILNSGVVFKCL